MNRWGENKIEFRKNQPYATCSFSQGRFVSRMQELAEKYPDKCQIVGWNQDGSIVAHFPVEWIQIDKV